MTCSTYWEVFIWGVMGAMTLELSKVFFKRNAYINKAHKLWIKGIGFSDVMHALLFVVFVLLGGLIACLYIDEATLNTSINAHKPFGLGLGVESFLNYTSLGIVSKADSNMRDKIIQKKQNANDETNKLIGPKGEN